MWKHLPTLCQVFQPYLHYLPLQNLTIYGCIPFQHIFVLTFHTTLAFGETLLFWQWDPSTYSFHWDPFEWYIYIQYEHLFTSQTPFKIVETPNFLIPKVKTCHFEGLGNAPFLLSHISTWIGVFDLGYKCVSLHFGMAWVYSQLVSFWHISTLVSSMRLSFW